MAGVWTHVGRNVTFHVAGLQVHATVLRWRCEWILIYTYFKLLYAVGLCVLHLLFVVFNLTTALIFTYAYDHGLLLEGLNPVLSGTRDIGYVGRGWVYFILPTLASPGCNHGFVMVYSKFQRSWASPRGIEPCFVEHILTAFLLYVSITHSAIIWYSNHRVRR